MLSKLAKRKNLQLELAFNRIIALAISLVSIPVVLMNCGTGNYGIYVVLCSISFFFTIVDLGIANGVVNELILAKSNRDQERVNLILTNLITFGVLLTIFTPLIGYLFMRIVQWESLFQIKMNSGESASLLLLAVFGASMSLLGNIGFKILLAKSQNRIFSRIQLLSTLLTNLALIISSRSHVPLKGMLFASLVLPHLIGVTILLLQIKLDKNLKITTTNFSIRIISNLISSGRVFLLLQIATIVNYQIDTLLIAHFMGNTQLAEYNITLKIGSLPFILISAAVQPIWAETAQLIAQKKNQDARLNLFDSLVRVIIFSLFSMIMFLFFGASLINKWTSGQINPSSQLIMANAIWIPISCIMQLMAMYFNGANSTKFLVLTTVLFSFANASIAVYFLKFQSNIAGPMWSNSISGLLFFVIPAIILIRQKSTKC